MTSVTRDVDGGGDGGDDGGDDSGDDDGVGSAGGVWPRVGMMEVGVSEGAAYMAHLFSAVLSTSFPTLGHHMTLYPVPRSGEGVLEY